MDFSWELKIDGYEITHFMIDDIAYSMPGAGTSGVLTSTLSCKTYYEQVGGNAFSWGAEVTLQTSDGTIVFPKYYVTNRDVHGYITHWTCSDRMCKTDVDVEFSDADFTDDQISANAVLDKACAAAGFSGVAYTAEGMAVLQTISGIDRSLVEDKTAREILEMFAAAMCGYWAVNSESGLIFSPYGKGYSAYLVQNYSEIPAGSQKTYTRVVMQDGGAVYTAGAGYARNTLTISTSLASEALCSAVRSNLDGFTYEAWSCKGITNMIIIPGYLGFDNYTVMRWCTNVNLHPTAAGIFFEASANNISENEHEYVSQVNRMLNRKAEWEQRNGNTALSKNGLKIFINDNSGKSTVISAVE